MKVAKILTTQTKRIIVPRYFFNESKTVKVGDRATLEKTITEDDVRNFAKLTGDLNPIHDSKSKNIVHGAYLIGLISGIIGTQLPGPGTMVVEQTIKYPKPCYAGESVQIIVEISSVRKLITCKYTCIANTDRLVLEGEAKLMPPKWETKEITFVE